MAIDHLREFPSDEIAIVIGFCGGEHRSVRKWAATYNGHFPCRLAVAVNTHYEELASCFYLNKRVLGVIQSAWTGLGVWTVVEDNYRSEGVVPTEPEGSIEVGNDDYLL